MNIFVSEFVCGGAWPEEQIETSLAREGRLMLTALVEDLSRLPDARVVTTWDARLGECPLKSCKVRVVQTRLQETTIFYDLVHSSDVVWVIAPESDGILFRRRAIWSGCLPKTLSDPHGRFVGSHHAAIALCSCKKALHELFDHLGIATPATAAFDPLKATEFVCSWPIVIKPRDGAGSQNTFLVRDQLDLANACRALKSVTDPDALIQQPYISGKPLSVALLIAEDGSTCETLPVAEQHLSTDGRFRYLGGRIPADISAESAVAVQQLAERACRAVPGLTGYVGCDIVLSDNGPLGPVLIEINPRLTSSYLGYRQLTDDNIPARLLDANSRSLRWKSEPVTFTV